jgi:hypothetical protein
MEVITDRTDCEKAANKEIGIKDSTILDDGGGETCGTDDPVVCYRSPFTKNGILLIFDHLAEASKADRPYVCKGQRPVCSKICESESGPQSIPINSITESGYCNNFCNCTGFGYGFLSKTSEGTIFHGKNLRHGSECRAFKTCEEWDNAQGYYCQAPKVNLTNMQVDCSELDGGKCNDNTCCQIPDCDATSSNAPCRCKVTKLEQELKKECAEWEKCNRDAEELEDLCEADYGDYGDYYDDYGEDGNQYDCSAYTEELCTSAPDCSWMESAGGVYVCRESCDEINWASDCDSLPWCKFDYSDSSCVEVPKCTETMDDGDTCIDAADETCLKSAYEAENPKACPTIGDTPAASQESDRLI